MEFPVHDAFIDYQRCTVRELIVGLMMHEGRPLRQVEIQHLLKKYYPRKIIKSKGALSLTFKELVESRAVVIVEPDFTYKVKSHPKFYKVNDQLPTRRQAFYNNVVEKLSMRQKEAHKPGQSSVMIREVLARPSSREVFQTLRDVDKFVHEMMMYLTRFEKLVDPKVVSELFFNRFWAYPTSRTETIPGVLYLMTRSENYVDHLRSGWLKGKRAVIRSGVKGIPVEAWMCSTQGLGNVILEIFYPENVYKSVESLLAEEDDLTEQQFKERCRRILLMNGKFAVGIRTHDDTVADKITMSLHTHREQLFGPLVDKLVHELKSTVKTIAIPEEYTYLSKEQAHEARAGLSIITYGDEIQQMTPLIREFVVQKTKKQEITLIDLGVGPAIKPIPIHAALNKHFMITDYIGVDASANILKLAEKDLKRYGLDLRINFLHLNFRDIKKNPDLLLKHLPNNQRLFLLLGNTYGNIEREDMAGFIGSIMKPGDLLVTEVDTVKDVDDARSYFGRYNEEPLLSEKKAFDCIALYEMGFEPRDIDYRFEFDESEFVGYGIATVKKVTKYVLPDLLSAGIMPDQRFRVFMSRKVSGEIFKKELESLGLNVRIHELKKDRWNLALCWKG